MICIYDLRDIQVARCDEISRAPGSPAFTSGTCSKAARFLSGRRQVGGFDCSCDEKKLFEDHPQFAKAALTEDECVEFKHFVADGDGQRR